VVDSGEKTYLKGMLAGGIWSLKIDNKYFTNTYFDYPLVAASMNENTENVLILGLGGGSTSNSFIHAFPDVHIDGVEIDSQVIEVGKKYFDMDSNNLDSISSDGRLFVKKTEKNYDIIFIDVYRDAYIPFHMATVEFFKEVRSILSDDGCVCINILTYNQKTTDAIFNTVLEAFPNVYRLKPTYSHNTFLYATNQQKNIDEIKQSIIDARDNLPFSEDVSNNEKIDLKLIFTDGYNKIEEYKKSDDLFYFTDDKVPLEYIIGMDVFPFN
jgi:predicted membrane-bound spermidine synthase